MDTLMIILRVFHIFAGLFWVGIGAVEVFLFTPLLNTVTATSSDGKPVKALIAKLIYDSPLVKIGFPVSATLTVVAGFWLYYETSDGFNADWMSLTSSMVLSTGVVLGIVALIHGGAVVGPLSGKTRKAAEAILQSDSPTEAHFAALDRMKQQHTLHANISMVLIVVTLFTMASFRYFGS